MGELIREGGWPMYPIVALGGAALLLALRYALYPQRSLRSLVLGVLAASVVMGVLGTALGVQASARAIGDVPDGQRWIFLIGLKESLNCLAAALTLALPTVLAIGAGSHRLGRRLEEMAIRSAAPGAAG